jgi:hypothetical protein
LYYKVTRDLFTARRDEMSLYRFHDLPSHPSIKQCAADLGTGRLPEGRAWPSGLTWLVVPSSVLGVLDGSWPGLASGSRAGLHALFGLLLITLVAKRFHGRLQRNTLTSQSDIRELSRELSRLVYLSLYVVIGLRELVGLAEGFWHHEAAQFGGFADGDLQTVIAYGVAGLIFIRVLAFGTWRHATRGLRGP